MARPIALAVRGASGMVTTFAAFAGDYQGAVAVLDAQGLDVGAGGLGDSQPVEREQGDEGVFRGSPKPSGDQQRAEFVAVQPDCVGLAVQPRLPYVRGGRMIELRVLMAGLDPECGHRRW